MRATPDQVVDLDIAFPDPLPEDVQAFLVAHAVDIDSGRVGAISEACVA